jgi:hypothetical protein
MLLRHLSTAPQMGTPLPSLTRERPISRGPACATSAEAKLTNAGQESRQKGTQKPDPAAPMTSFDLHLTALFGAASLG